MFCKKDVIRNFQVVYRDLFFYSDDSFLVYQHRDVKVIEQNSTKFFCCWFGNNKLSIHVGKDKDKSIIPGTKKRLKKDSNLNIRYGAIPNKQYHALTYLGCLVDENLSREPIAFQVIKKISARLRFYIGKMNFCPTRFVDFCVM